MMIDADAAVSRRRDPLRGLFPLECATAALCGLGGLAVLWLLGFGQWPGWLLLEAGAWQAWEAVKTRRMRQRWAAMDRDLAGLRREQEEARRC